MPAYPSSPHAFKKIKKPLHSSDLVRLIEPCGPLHDGEPKLYDRCSCSYAYGIRVRVHDGASLVGMYASCVFTSIRDFYLQKLCNSILIITWITSISKHLRVNQSPANVWIIPIGPLYAISPFWTTKKAIVWWLLHRLLKAQRYDGPFGHHRRLQGHQQAFQMWLSLRLQAWLQLEVAL